MPHLVGHSMTSVAPSAHPLAIAVTGSTGRIGGIVARRLSEAGRPLRLLVRDPARAPQLHDTTVFEASYADKAAVRTALTGAKLAFMVSAAESADRVGEHLNFVSAAAEAGVEHVVYLSFAGASPTCTFLLGRDHAATEAAIRASGMHFTFVRDNFYADFMPAMVGEDGIIRGPAGDGRVAVVAQTDAAAAVADVLLDPAAHVDATYTLTGPEALTMTEIAAIVSEAQGREVRFHNETMAEAKASRASYGAPDWLVDAWISTYTAIAVGEVAEVTGDVELLTGRPPVSLRNLLTTS